ncbi:MAG: hypothetical protein JRJ82_20925 [Deltaproteobacteria bacterium]|nr:hypothetical protein [Deltaproteobacteria bacterium]
MVSRKRGIRTLTLAVVVGAAFFLQAGPLIAAPYKSWPAKKEKKPAITQIQIQSEIMGFAETFAATIIQSFDDFAVLTREGHKQAYITAYGDALSSSASALTVAAEPNPAAGMLDLVVMTTLGRMIWEEHWLPRFGDPAMGMVERLKELEEGIWTIVAKVLTAKEQKELRDIIVGWRRDHPKQLAFSYIRFNDFAEWRKASTLAKGGKPSGLFKSVAEVAQAADEMRLLGERALFLGTRMPLLTGDFADLWVSRILYNPEVQRILDNMDKVSDSATALSDEIKQLPDRFAVERDATIDKTMARVSNLREKLTEDVMDRVTLERTAAIDQLMDRVARERQALFKDLTPQGDGKTGLLPELRLALVQGNEMFSHIKETTGIINTLYDKTEDDSAPFNIKDYTEVLAQASETTREMLLLVKAVNDLFTPLPSGERPMLRLLNSLDRVEKEGENLIDHTFYRAIIMILVTLFGFFLLMIVYRYASVRILERQG